MRRSRRRDAPRTPRVGHRADLVAWQRSRAANGSAAGTICFQLRQLIDAGGGERHAGCRRHQHADANRSHGRRGERHADDVRDSAKRHPDGKISGEQRQLRAARPRRRARCATRPGGDAAVLPASPTAASSQSSSPSTSRETSWRGRDGGLLAHAIQAIDIDHPPGIGMAADIESAAVDGVSPGRELVTIAAATTAERSLVRPLRPIGWTGRGLRRGA